MNQFVILCIADEDDVLATFNEATRPFATQFETHFVSNLRTAYARLEQIRIRHQELALVIATLENNNEAAQLLIELGNYYPSCRRVLTSEPHELSSVLKAVNEGRLDHCFTKPLGVHSTSSTLCKELTQFILSQPQADWLSYASVLDSNAIIRAHIDQRIYDYRDDFIKDYHSITDEELSEKVCRELEEFFEKSDETNAIRQYSASHLLTSEGKPNEYLWFITQGEVALYKHDSHGKQQEVIRHAKGGIIGGMSFVTGEKAFSTALTLTPTKVIKLDKDTFTRVMHSNSRLLPLFTNLLLRHANRRLQRSIYTKMRLQNTFESLEAAQSQLIENEKMVVLGQLVAGVAHELNNPIAAILRCSETLMEEMTRPAPQGDHSELGMQVLHRAMQCNPMSTSEMRQKTKQLSKEIPDKAIAKKLIQLGLWEQTEQIKTENLPALIEELSHYHTQGATLRSIHVCAQRIANMVKSLKSYARADEESIQRVNIHEGIEDTLVIFENKLKRHKVERLYQDIPPLLCQPIALQQVWTNLISNAIDAMATQGNLSIQTRLVEEAGLAMVEVTFSDTGHGIELEQLPHIFELNYTTKKEGDFGLGIGLSVCHQIVQGHGGRIKVDSTPGSGTRMKVLLPIDGEIENIITPKPTTMN